jgi:heme-degrading monooxygenase HmoA
MANEKKETSMYAVLRQYSGSGAPELFDVLEEKAAEVESIIRGVPGFVSYALFRTASGGVSVTVCNDKAGADESSRRAAEFVKENETTATSSPTISEGETILQLT